MPWEAISEIHVRKYWKFEQTQGQGEGDKMCFRKTQKEKEQELVTGYGLKRLKNRMVFRPDM